MSVNFHRRLFIPVLAMLLSACGGTSTRGPELLSASNSPTAAAVTSDTPAPTHASASPTPTVAPTLAPASPMPGMVFLRSGSDAANRGLWIVQADGQLKQLSTKPDARLSPDQTQVLYGENGEIWLQDLATGKTTNLSRTKDKVEMDYQWWPARPGVIVFHYQPATDLQPMAGYLATVKTDGTNYLVLDQEVGSNSPAALSSDGQTIAYDRGGQPWVYNLSGGNMPILPKSFTEKFRIACNPAWSPDGQKLAWQLFGDQAGTDGWSAVAVLDFNTLHMSLIHRYTIIGGSDIGNYHLAWSADGQWLAVVNQAERSEDGRTSLWIMRSDDSEEHHIGAYDRPVWNPDGRMVAYRTQDGVSAVKVGEWNPFPITLPADALVIDWVTVK
jgi:hypothetical protein